MSKNIAVMQSFIRDTWWMARRYADRRCTYAPGAVNDAILRLKKSGLGHLVEQVGNDPQYATDGMFGEYDPETRMFKGSPSEVHDSSGWHNEAAEREMDKKGLPRWKNKQTGRVCHVVTMAEDANEGPYEGSRVVVYCSEQRTYVMDQEAFMDKFERQEGVE